MKKEILQKIERKALRLVKNWDWSKRHAFLAGIGYVISFIEENKKRKNKNY